LLFRRWPKSIVAGVTLGLLLLVFLALRFSFPSKPEDSETAPFPSVDQSLEDFFKAYWQRPIPPQGPAPAGFSEKEASLSPEACGSCHAKQYADWKESLHSRSMGPGPWG